MDDVAKDAAGEPDAADVVTRVHKTMDKIDRMAGVASTNTNGTQNNATWNVNAGGVGVWLCVTACAVMFALTVVLGVLFIDLSRKYDRMQDYYNIILQHAPELKDIIKKETE